MAAKKTSAVSTRAGGAVSVPEELAEKYSKYITQTKATTKSAGSGWPWISTRGGMLALPGGGQPTNALECVILASVRENIYYEGAFDPDNAKPPTCFAIDSEGHEDLMGPPSTLKTKQADKCVDCQKNEWGSGTGRGKACKNQVRLLIMPWNSNGMNEVDIKEQECARLRIPVTSLGGYPTSWSDFASEVSTGMNRPLFGVVAALGVKPDPKSQYKLHFAVQQEIGFELWDALSERVDAAENQLLQLPDTSGGSGEAPQAQTRSKGKTRKKVVRKKMSARKRR